VGRRLCRQGKGLGQGSRGCQAVHQAAVAAVWREGGGGGTGVPLRCDLAYLWASGRVEEGFRSATSPQGPWGAYGDCERRQGLTARRQRPPEERLLQILGRMRESRKLGRLHQSGGVMGVCAAVQGGSTNISDSFKHTRGLGLWGTFKIVTTPHHQRGTGPLWATAPDQGADLVRQQPNRPRWSYRWAQAAS
jgi:hypothetical protein